MAQLQRKITFNQRRDALDAGRPLPGDRPRRTVLRQVGDPARVPDGYDPDLWHIAVFFHEEGRKQHVPMAHRPPVIYERIREIVEDTGLRDGKWDNVGHFGSKEVTGFPGGLDFITVMEKMVTRYWDKYHDWDRDPRADEHFCQHDVFTHVRDAVLSRVVSRQIHLDIQHRIESGDFEKRRAAELEEQERQREAARATAPGTEQETDVNTIRIYWQSDGRWRIPPRTRPGYWECACWVSPEWVAAHDA